ncbi:MAG: DNA ligase D [Chitinispirillaceae bacterium]
MQLEDYGKKRDFSSTSEPAPELSGSSGEKPRFVVQKHRASHLHYDLRLELQGVLKSWAVPKGPSLDPAKKRLAMMVEDHPYDYRNFEGIIPEGNYGAGTVMIWDEGCYSVPGKKGKKETEEAFRNGLSKGNAVFTLEGQKLKGMYHLVKISGKGDNSWLLLKKTDGFSRQEGDVLQKDRSVRTGLSLDQIRAADATKDTSSDSPAFFREIISDAPRREFSGPLRPMLAQLVEEPFDKEGWFFEIKWDGYRAVAECLHGAVRLYSRNGLSVTGHYPPVVRDLRSLPFEAVLDGEIVVLDSKGRSDFGALQNYRRKAEGTLVYYVFDLLYFEGYDLTGLPLHRRKELLKSVIPPLDHLKFNAHIETSGRNFYEGVKQLGLEGVVAKESGSPYVPGSRSWHWRKIKIVKQQEAVVGGFTEPKGGRKFLGSLIVGVYENDKLTYISHVGSGFSDSKLAEVREKLDKLITPQCPFSSNPASGEKAHWVRPELVCVVRFSEWTNDGSLRHPVFLGFREDKQPRWVVREKPSRPEPRFAPVTREQKLRINDKTVSVTNADKTYWPDENITKGEMINYYRSVAEWLLPHLKDRPQSLHRFPDGINGKHFFHKDMDSVPDWVQTTAVESDEGKVKTRYLVCQDEAALIYMANLGAIEINPWISRISSPDFPDVMVIDLDPLECPFSDVVETAGVVHSVLSEIDIPHYVKTSGATGLHIFVPLEARYTYDQSRQFALLVCTFVNKELPSITSLERLPSRRAGKVYLDFLQNTKGKTMACAYSLRPRPGAPVSAPLHWDEVNGKLDPSAFSIRTIGKRLEEMGDLWRPVLGKGIDMASALERLKDLFGSGI